MAHRRSGISKGNADLRIRTKYLGPKRDRASDARRRLAQSDCRSRNSSVRQTGRLSGSAAVKIEIYEQTIAKIAGSPRHLIDVASTAPFQGGECARRDHDHRRTTRTAMEQ